MGLFARLRGAAVMWGKKEFVRGTFHLSEQKERVVGYFFFVAH